MICIRCEGRMVHERFLDLFDGEYAFMGWRCLNCGEIHDHGILSNRRDQASPDGSPRIERGMSVVNGKFQPGAYSVRQVVEPTGRSERSPRSHRMKPGISMGARIP